jgi:hypothetical protein
MDLLASDMSTDTKEWRYHADHNYARRMTANMPTETEGLQRIFDTCVQRCINHPENALTSTGEWPHHLYHEGGSVQPTLPSMPIKAEERPIPPKIERLQRLLNNGPWKGLPSGKEDLNKLIHWLDRHDGEWLADALWLRYTKVAKVVYSDRSFLITHRDRVSTGVIKETKCFPKENPPMPYNILPIMQSHDEVDRLSGLPHDIRVEILSYLLLPNINMRLGCPEIVDHPLNSVALVSRSWRDQVDAFYGHALLVWKQRVRKGSAAEYFANFDELDSWVEWWALKSYTSCARMEYVFRSRTCCALCGTDRECLVLSDRLEMMWCGDCQNTHETQDFREQDAYRLNRGW